MQTRPIFITGATGFIGKELVKRILTKQDARLYLLIRSRKQETAEGRLSNYIDALSGELGIPRHLLSERIRLVEGCLGVHQFGLDNAAFEHLASCIGAVFHLAANVKLHDSLENLCKINIGGTREVLKLAKRAKRYGQFEALHYLSTAYVAGKRKGRILESELDENQGFICNYEKVKFEAEQIVEKAKPGLPVVIYRPSMVAGDSETGITCAFNVIYEPLKMMIKGKLPLWSAGKYAVIDVVPVNYVCDALLHLSSIPEQTLGKTFHLTIGPGREITSRGLLECSFNYLKDQNQEQVSKPFVVTPFALKWAGLAVKVFGNAGWRRMAKSWLTFADYTTYHKSFDNSAAVALLKPAGIVAPKLQDYLGVLCRYAVQQQFGWSKPIGTKPASLPGFSIGKTG